MSLVYLPVSASEFLYGGVFVFICLITKIFTSLLRQTEKFDGQSVNRFVFCLYTIQNQMKAITRRSYGSPDVLTIQEMEKPVPKKNEVLIRVHATTVNRTDCGILWGKPFIIRFFTGLFKPKALIPGTDFAGQIEAVGEEVTNFKVGDKVWGLDDNGLGSHAQYITLNEDRSLITMPQHISFAEAVACAEGAHYAYNYVKYANLQPGQNVLINGATGAIGSSAVQIFSHYDIPVTAVANTPNLDLVRSLGAKKIVDYLKEDFTQDTQQYDLVFDAVGKSSFGKCKDLLKPGGIYISTELGHMSQNVFLALLSPLMGSKKVKFPVPVDCKGSLTFMKTLIETGKFQPVIDKIYPMDQIQEAYTYVNSGKKTGNVVIKFD